MKKLSLIFVFITILSTGIVQAAPIEGLFNTGVDEFGLVLPIGSVEQHYSMTGPSMEAYTIAAHIDWVTPPSDASWIGPIDGDYSGPDGEYRYSLTFELTDLDPMTATISGQWSTDNTGVILLNGIETGNISSSEYSFRVLHDFSISDGFISGTNTLEFVVTNIPAPSTNPTGLLVANIIGDASEVPVPSSVWLLGSCLISIAAVRSKFKTS